MRTFSTSELLQSFISFLSLSSSPSPLPRLKRNCFEKSPLLYTQQGNCIFTAAFYCQRIKRIMSSPAHNLPYRDILFGIIRRSRAYVKLFSYMTRKFHFDIVRNTFLEVLYAIKKGLKGYRAYTYPFYRNLW